MHASFILLHEERFQNSNHLPSLGNSYLDDQNLEVLLATRSEPLKGGASCQKTLESGDGLKALIDNVLHGLLNCQKL